MIKNFHPRHLPPVLMTGLVAGLLEIALATLFAALIFGGDLSSYIPQGIGLALMGTILGSAVFALISVVIDSAALPHVFFINHLFSITYIIIILNSVSVVISMNKREMPIRYEI